MKTRILTLLICSLTLFNAGAVTITAVPNEEKKDVELQGTTEKAIPKCPKEEIEHSLMNQLKLIINSQK